MGILRLILAFSVVSGHGDFWRPFFFVNASAAVACFFVISGFYMALVLGEKYASRTEFFKARLWRLYPAYLIFTALYMALWLYDGHAFTPLGVLLSVTLLGQDYFGILLHDDPLKYIPIAQAWSVAVELQLYFIAALAFRGARGIVAVFIVGCVLRAALVAQGLAENPLGVWFLPNVICYFGAGGVAYLAYKHAPKRYVALVGAGALLFLALYSYVYAGFWGLEARGSDARLYPLYLGIACALPFLFTMTRNSAYDRKIGDLSYPVYLSHILVFDVAHRLGQGRWFVLFGVVALSIAVHLFVEGLRLRWNRAAVLEGTRSAKERRDPAAARIH